MSFAAEVWDPVLLRAGGPRRAKDADAPQQQQQQQTQAQAQQQQAQQTQPQQQQQQAQLPAQLQPAQQPAARGAADRAPPAQASAARPPKSPSLVPKKTGIMYRIFQLGDATPEHHDDDPHDPHARSAGFLWARSRRSFSGSEADSDEFDSDDSGISGASRASAASRRSSVSGKMARKPSIGDAMDQLFKRSGSASLRSNRQPSANSLSSAEKIAAPALPAAALPQQPAPARRSTSKKGIFSIGAGSAGDDSSDLDSDLDDAAAPRKPARGNLFKDLLQGTRSKRPSKAASPAVTPPHAEAHAQQHPAGLSIFGTPSREDPPSPVDSDHKQESLSIFKDLLSPRSKRAPTASNSTSAGSLPRISAPVVSGPPSPAPLSKAPSTSSPVDRLSPPSPMHSTPSLAQANHPLPLHLQSSQGQTQQQPAPAGVPLERKSSAPGLARSGSSDISLDEKYGKPEDVLGRGAYATVKLCCPINSKQKYAIKEFRKRRKDETQKEYVKKLISEFCISSSLEHENVVKTVDLIQDSKRQWCVVMEYCAGGDLFARIQNGSLKNYSEMNCYFMQLVRGVHYLHSMGVSHRDLKPENLLLDSTGRLLKITDFGVSQVFRDPFGTVSKKTRGVAGSGPYIAPEEFSNEEYDPEAVDVWSIGIIFFVIMNNSILWKTAIPSDPRYKQYLDSVTRFAPFERLPYGAKEILYKILDPNPKTRIKLPAILDDFWCKSISVCTASNADKVDHRHESHNK